MKKTMTIALLGAALVTVNLVACGGDQLQKAKEASDKVTHLDTGLEKPMAASQSKTLDRFTNGLYRLREMRMQADFDIPASAGKEATKLSMAARQSFVKKRNATGKFDVELSKLQKSNLNGNSKRNDINMTVSLQMKVPLTIRLNQGQVSFEQLRLFWICAKNTGACDRENYLSAGASDNQSVINPAKYLVTKGLGSSGEDLATQIRSMKTGGSDSSMIVEFENKLDDDHTALIRLTFDRDLREYDMDRQNNSDEESLRTSEPAP